MKPLAIGQHPLLGYNGAVKHLWPLLPLLVTACSFDGSGLSVPGAGSPDLRSVDVVPRLDAALDSDALDPCRPNPCENGGTCAQGDGGTFVCQCATGFDGPSCGKCALGYAGPICTVCPETKLTIQTCTNADIVCSEWTDGDPKTMTSNKCPSNKSGCFATDFDLDLGTRQYVHRLRFLSDWWNKRPGDWDLWASDDNVHFSLVMTARSNKAPWECLQDVPCTAEVPTECCPGGVIQDTATVGRNYPKWDDFTFSGVTARYWRFHIKTTDDADNLIMRELELYGHDCLGELACATSSCGWGVCTGQEKERCTCAGCPSPGSCTSAFTGVAPACTTVVL